MTPFYRGWLNNVLLVKCGIFCLVIPHLQMFPEFVRQIELLLAQVTCVFLLEVVRASNVVDQPPSVIERLATLVTKHLQEDNKNKFAKKPCLWWIKCEKRYSLQLVRLHRDVRRSVRPTGTGRRNPSRTHCTECCWE